MEFLMNLAWLTDIHKLATEKDRCLFYRSIYAEIDGLMISGDIADAHTISSVLVEMAHHIMKPIYFVLGNNDYYCNSISHTHQNLHWQTLLHPLIHWLPIAGPIKLNQSTVLLSADTWPDGRLGDFYNSKFCDSMKIVDLQEARKKGKHIC